MKYLIEKSKAILVLLAATLLVGISACDITEPDLPFDLEGTLNNNGAYLRVLNYDSPVFDLANPQEAEFSMTIEFYDGKEVSSLDNVEFFVAYEQFSLSPGSDPNQVIIDETDSPFLTVPASAFTENEDGLLQTQVTIPLTSVADALGLDINDIGVEDTFEIRWALNTTDGRTFTTTNTSTAVSGGFYNSPYFRNVPTVQELPSDVFVGEYELQQQQMGPVGLWLFGANGDPFTVELSVDPNNPLNGRVFTAAPYPAFGLSPVQVPIVLGRTATVSGGPISLPLGCSVGLAFGPASSNLVEINVNDDSSFTLVITENTESDCSAPPQALQFSATKL